MLSAALRPFEFDELVAQAEVLPVSPSFGLTLRQVLSGRCVLGYVRGTQTDTAGMLLHDR